MTPGTDKKTRKDFMQDPSFVQWCLAPTEESNNQWDNYIKKHPEKKEGIEQARKQIRQVKLNPYKLSTLEKQSLNQSIAKDYTRNKQRRRRQIIWQYAAACIILLGLSYTVWFMHRKTIMPDTESGLLIANIQPDTTITEVELQLATQKKMQIANKATIRINEQGNVRVSDTDIETIKEAEETKKESIHTLIVPKGRHSSVILADGTKVWVNSGTVLRFPSYFDHDKRMIYVEGEIYLEVKKDPSRPFHVKTSKMDVRVLGTSFNVTAYKEDTEQAVILKNGSVSVCDHTGSEKAIKPNERLVLHDEKMSVDNVNVYDYISWIDGVFQFTGKNLEEILQRLSRYYKVEFIYSSEIKDLKCSGKLVLFDDMEQVLQTLQKSFPISYKISGNTVNLSIN